MDHLGEDLSAVGEAAHSVLRDAKMANVWVTGGDLLKQQATIVETDGTTRLGDYPEKKAVIGGFSIIEVPTLEDALYWARRISEACRCAQQVRLLMDDPEV